MIIKYTDPITGSIRITECEDAIWKKPHTEDQFLSFGIHGFKVYVNVYAPDDIIEDMLDTMFKDEKVDIDSFVEIDGSAHVAVEFNTNDSDSETTDVLADLIGMMCEAMDSDDYDDPILDCDEADSCDDSFFDGDVDGLLDSLGL